MSIYHSWCCVLVWLTDVTVCTGLAIAALSDTHFPSPLISNACGDKQPHIPGSTSIRPFLSDHYIHPLLEALHWPYKIEVFSNFHRTVVFHAGVMLEVVEQLLLGGLICVVEMKGAVL